MALPHTNSIVNPNSGSNNNENITEEKKRCCKNIIFTIYISHILTSWGDRMWGFAVGLYLIILFPESLQYTAIFGFTTCISVIIGGPFIGKWVDKTSRLKAAKCALVTQNLAVMCCAILLIIFINYDDKSKLNSNNKVLDWVFLILIIIFAVTGELASVASKIALEKDWIVVLAHGNERRLSKMNATMRTIDLTTSIMAPAVVAQIIAFVSQTAGAGFIASWNVVSGMVEIYLLHKIYKAIPELSLKKLSQENIGNIGSNNQPGVDPSALHNGNKNMPHIFIEGSSPNSDNKTPSPYNEAATAQLSLISTPNTNNNHIRMEELIHTPTGQTDGLLARDFAEISLRTPSPRPSNRHSNTGLTGLFKSPDSYVFGSSIQQLVVQDTKKKNVAQHIRTRIVDSMIGWKQYYKHPLRNAGVGLALLYMTVLGFDTITIGYMYSQGVSESLIGILTAVGAVFGILGSVSFPFLRRIFGKSTVGIFGFGFETLCLVMCVVSIFVPGSSFVPEALWEHFSATSSVTDQNNNGTLVTSSSESPGDESTTPYDSIIMFTVGILLSRYGLWIADLSVTQFFQEEVHESQRGILNGVQDALNQVMSLIKFILVIILPTTPTFGYLIALSWCFVFMGWVSFIIFSISWRRRQNRIKCTTVPATTLN